MARVAVVCRTCPMKSLRSHLVPACLFVMADHPALFPFLLRFLKSRVQTSPYHHRDRVLQIRRTAASVSRTGIFHVLFAFFFSTLTNTILQILYYHPHHTRFKPFRLLTQFTEEQENTRQERRLSNCPGERQDQRPPPG